MKKLAALLLFLALISVSLVPGFAEPKNCPYSLWKTSIHYRNMTYAQRIAFDALYDGVRAQEAVIPISDLTKDEAYLMMDTLFNECAELCSLSSWTLWGRTVNGVWTPTEMHIEYKRSKAEQDRFINEVASIARQFSSINDVYVYLCQKLSYGDASVHPEQRWAYESLKTGKAVCNGYAQCLAMLCHFAGFECSYMDGMGNGGRHAWNVIRIGDDYTLVDCTWDDNGSSPDYRWFALSDREMNQSHTPDPEYKVLPACKNLQGSTLIAKWHTVAFDYSNCAFTLKQNDSGETVRKINRRLIELGYLSGSAHSSYNSSTKNAVAAFQQTNGIHGNSASMGVCTQLTQAALFADTARRKNSSAVKPDSTINASPFTVYIGSNYGVRRSGSGGTLTFTVKNNNPTRAITILCIRYWADDSRGKLVYTVREQLLTNLNIAPGEMRELTVNLAEDSGFKSAYTFKWNITELGYASGEVFINENLSGSSYYSIATYNETVK